MPLESKHLLLIKRIATAYGLFSAVEAVVFSGSSTTSETDAKSDIDLYVYVTDEIALDDRRKIAESASERVDFDNRFWEPGDEWVDNETGIKVDVMFRRVHWIEEQLAWVLEQHEASVGYSTCFWHNVNTSQILLDKNGWFGRLQQLANRPYPEQLQRNIIAKNYPILRDTLSSYRTQIETAVAREDWISVNHRIAALLTSYFDILFALNKLPHPGEKRLLNIATSNCKIRPDKMKEQVGNVLQPSSKKGSVVLSVDELIDGLDRTISENVD
ncbi:MAG: DUF4037 domain-containing protein [Calditrichia bacterium]